MTTGYPDWQGYAKWQGVPVINLFNHDFVPGVTPFGPFNSFNFRGIYINAFNMPGNHTITVKWFADSVATELLNTEQYDFHGGESLNVCIDADFPFYTIEVNNLTAGNLNGVLYVAPTNAVNVASKFNATSFGRKLVVINTVVNAGANAQVHSPALYAGPATLAVQQALNNNWHAQLQSWNSGNNAYDVIAEIDGATAGRFYVGRVTCPRGTMNIAVFNDDAANQNMIASLVAG